MAVVCDVDCVGLAVVCDVYIVGLAVVCDVYCGVLLWFVMCTMRSACGL